MAPLFIASTDIRMSPCAVIKTIGSPVKVSALWHKRSHRKAAYALIPGATVGGVGGASGNPGRRADHSRHQTPLGGLERFRGKALGDVVRVTEPDFDLVECFSSGNRCAITGTCRLRRILHEGLDAFTVVLDKYTLADLMLRPKDFGARPAA
jgi:hypothetical protein